MEASLGYVFAAGKRLRSSSVRGAVAAVGTGVGASATADFSLAMIVVPERNRLAVGDVKLYEREMWLTRLSAHPSESDLSLLLKAIEKEGADVLARIAGDFAFVVWDGDRAELLAARDHFGIRPLYYRTFANGLALATDPRALLSLPPVDPDVDRETVLDFLFLDFAHAGRSVFRVIRKVRPGHRVSAGRDMFKERRYWTPSTEVVGRASYADYVDEWRHHLRVAVRDRLSSAGPIVAHLSGGLDSSSIVCLAHRIYSESTGSRPPFTTVSAVYPGLECDETRYIDDVVREIPLFESVRFDGRVFGEKPFDSSSISFPGLGNGPGGGSWGDVEVVHARKATVLLTGVGGDEVGRSWHVFRDLWSNGRLGTILEHILSASSWGFVHGCLLEGATGLLPPSLIDVLRRPHPLRRQVPRWLGSELVRTFPGLPDESLRSDVGTSHVQRGLLAALGSPQLHQSIDATVLTGIEQDVEVRMPYLDVRLVEFTMKIPWELRVPRGYSRRTQRDGVAPFVPASVREHPKITMDAVIGFRARATVVQLREILFDSRWASEGLINQNEARKAFDELRREDPSFRRWRGWSQLARIANLEAWLRAVMRYSFALS